MYIFQLCVCTLRDVSPVVGAGVSGFTTGKRTTITGIGTAQSYQLTEANPIIRQTYGLQSDTNNRRKI